MFVPIDYFFIAIYLILVVAIGYVASKRETEESFLIADRKLGILSGIATINATKTGGILLAYTALLYFYGISAFWVFIGIGLGYFAFIPFAKKLRKISEGRFYTLGDYFRKKFSPLSAKLASSINIIMMVGFFVASLVGSAKVINLYTGINYTVATILTSSVVLIYLLLAGFKAVVKTDVLQYGVIVFILALFAGTLMMGGGFEVGDMNIVSAGAKTIIGFLLMGFLLPFASPDLWQRVYAMKDTDTMSKSIFYSIIIYVVVGAILTLVGLAIKSALPGLDPDTAIIEGFTQLLPVGFGGLAVIVFFGAFMSSMDTYAFTAASSFVQDYLSRDYSKRKVVKLTRIFIAVMVVICTIVALLLASVIVTTYLFVAFAAALAVPVIATWVRPSIKRLTIEITLVVGLVFLLLISTLDILGAGIEPTLIVKGMAGSLLGLCIGSVTSIVRRS
ncbi:sodium:solute symporter family protein [Candidatus Uhrbacteria bacterium]|nr:sodium:solute symporter family protein [Candidatus Uhrbacteria bacterium]